MSKRLVRVGTFCLPVVALAFSMIAACSSDEETGNTVSPDAAGWIYSVQMVSDASSALGSNACINEVTSGALTITVTTPNGVATSVAYPVTD